MAITMISFATTISGFVTETSGESVVIEIISEDGEGKYYYCESDDTFLGLKKRQSFSINLEKDSHYTLIFSSISEDKYVYIDTYNISGDYIFEVIISAYDTAVYFEPFFNSPSFAYIERSFLDWICDNFPQVRDYNAQLEELSEEPIDCD